jgi:dephospho-CoA kinase
MKKLIAIVGMSGSGKSVASDYLESIGFNKIYFGGVVLTELKKRKMEITPDNEKFVREDLRREFGMAAMAIKLLPEIKKSIKKQDTVLDGLYSWDEYVVLKKEFKEDIKVICVVTDRKLRYSRVAERPVRPLNREEIEKRDYAEIENLAKGGPIAIADYFILNNGTVKDYNKRLKEILESIEKGE